MILKDDVSFGKVPQGHHGAQDSLSADSMSTEVWMALLVPSVPHKARMVVGARSRATPECRGPAISLRAVWNFPWKDQKINEELEKASLCNNMSMSKFTHAHTQTHTHIYIYCIYIYTYNFIPIDRKIGIYRKRGTVDFEKAWLWDILRCAE